MAVSFHTFYSKELGYNTTVAVAFPEIQGYEKSEKNSPCKVLYLLHGKGDTYSDWIRKTKLELYIEQENMVVVMPQGEVGFYTDTTYGTNYFRYITKELPYIMQHWYRISDRPEDTFIAGLSMGGYGALMAGLVFPEQYAGVGFFSAVVNPDTLRFEVEEENNRLQKNLHTIFGRIKPVEDRYKPEILLERAIDKNIKLPKLIQYIGREDFLYQDNQKFLQNARAYGAEILYEEWNGGHEWEFWDIAIKKAVQQFCR